MNPQDLAFRLLRHPLRLLSLRSIVIVGQLAVIILVLTLGVWVWVGVTNDQYNQLDRRLDSLSSLGDVNTLLRGAQENGVEPQHAANGLVRTARIGPATVSMPNDIVLPELPRASAVLSWGTPIKSPAAKPTRYGSAKTGASYSDRACEGRTPMWPLAMTLD